MFFGIAFSAGFSFLEPSNDVSWTSAQVDLLGDEALRSDWTAELEEIRSSVGGLRAQLVKELQDRSGSDLFAFIGAHSEMFSLLGTTPDQVAFMRAEKGIYMVGNGRVNIAGLNEASVPVLAEAMLEAGL